MSKPKARVLCVWELGTELGHLSHLRLPIEVALEQGHEVFVAARETHRIGQALGVLPITILQAPFKTSVAIDSQMAFLSYTHLLARQCFSSTGELDSLLRAWIEIFDLVRPDVVLFESSPTALVASHGYAFHKVLVGNGFAIPPDTGLPFAPFVNTPKTAEVWAGLCADDAKVTALINTALQRLGKPVFHDLAAIFRQAGHQFLTSWPVLDHFGARVGARYLGVAALVNKSHPRWPATGCPKVLGYLQYFPAIEVLLRDLQSSGVCALLLVRGLPAVIRQQYASASIAFTEEFVDLQVVASQAAWVVHHGNHSTMATFMLAGVPQFVIPRHQEQLFGSLRLVSAGCAAMAFQDQSAFSAAINAMQTNALMKQCAMQVASQCAPFDLVAVKEFIGQTFDQLL